ncbi:hypothetical protein DCCM_3521 [Desulfocucumis palustris]|uniref:Uncharacterized protein n=1 Tax=Desulfocucumis palustris TaxID=1898651 RepID=A0A2L2XDU3_9FIRM|nr:hypothetical protein DCCM_3521 [Desulfocucumis palustris]
MATVNCHADAKCARAYAKKAGRTNGLMKQTLHPGLFIY